MGKINIFCIQELKVVTRLRNADLSSYEPISLTVLIDTNIFYSILNDCKIKSRNESAFTVVIIYSVSQYQSH